MRRLGVTVSGVLGFGLFALAAHPLATTPTVYTSAQAEAGQAAYASSCQKCHSETLMGRDGTGTIPEFLQPYAGKIPPLAGANSAFVPFLTKWGPQKTDVLYRRIREAVGGFPPPGRKVDEELCLQLTAYVLQVNGALPGTEPLTPATAVEIRSITSAGR